MELQDYWLTVRRRWRLIAVTVLVAVGLAGLLTLQATPLYASTAQLFVSTPSSDTADASVGDQFATRRVASYVVMAGNRKLSETVANNLGGQRATPAHDAQAFASPAAAGGRPDGGRGLQAGARVGPARPGARGPFASAEPAHVASVLGRAGFTGITLRPFDHAMRHAGEVAEIAATMARMGPASRLIADAPEDVRGRIVEDLAEAIAPRHDGKAIDLAAAAWIVTGSWFPPIRPNLPQSLCRKGSFPSICFTPLSFPFRWCWWCH